MMAVDGDDTNNLTAANSNVTLPANVDDYWWYDDEGLTTRQARTIAYLPKPFAVISICSSYVLIREVLQERPNGGSPLNRTLLSMAVGDICFSFAMLLGTLPAPPEDAAYGIVGAHGNTQFCTFQGFVAQFGWLLSLLASTSLSIYYLLIIRLEWRDRDLMSVEKYVQGTVWFLSLAGAIYPIPLELYNSYVDICWIESLPPNCGYDDDDYYIPCERGITYAATHQQVYATLPIILLLISLVNMFLIFRKVRQLENRNQRYSSIQSSQLIPASQQLPTATTQQNNYYSGTGTGTPRPGSSNCKISSSGSCASSSSNSRSDNDEDHSSNNNDAGEIADTKFSNRNKRFEEDTNIMPPLSVSSCEEDVSPSENVSDDLRVDCHHQSTVDDVVTKPFGDNNNNNNNNNSTSESGSTTNDTIRQDLNTTENCGHERKPMPAQATINNDSETFHNNTQQQQQQLGQAVKHSSMANLTGEHDTEEVGNKIFNTDDDDHHSSSELTPTATNTAADCDITETDENATDHGSRSNENDVTSSSSSSTTSSAFKTSTNGGSDILYINDDKDIPSPSTADKVANNISDQSTTTSSDPNKSRPSHYENGNGHHQYEMTAAAITTTTLAVSRCTTTVSSHTVTTSSAATVDPSNSNAAAASQNVESTQPNSSRVLRQRRPSLLLSGMSYANLSARLVNRVSDAASSGGDDQEATHFTMGGGRTSSTTTLAVNRRKSQAVFQQALYYSLAFLATYSLTFISSTITNATGGWNVLLDHFAYEILLTSAGTFNFFVFARTRKMKTREGKLWRSLLYCVYGRRKLREASEKFDAARRRGRRGSSTREETAQDVEAVG